MKRRNTRLPKKYTGFLVSFPKKKRRYRREYRNVENEESYQNRHVHMYPDEIQDDNLDGNQNYHFNEDQGDNFDENQTANVNNDENKDPTVHTDGIKDNDAEVNRDKDIKGNQDEDTKENQSKNSKIKQDKDSVENKVQDTEENPGEDTKGNQSKIAKEKQDKHTKGNPDDDTKENQSKKPKEKQDKNTKEKQNKHTEETQDKAYKRKDNENQDVDVETDTNINLYPDTHQDTNFETDIYCNQYDTIYTGEKQEDNYKDEDLHTDIGTKEENIDEYIDTTKGQNDHIQTDHSYDINFDTDDSDDYKVNIDENKNETTDDTQTIDIETDENEENNRDTDENNDYNVDINDIEDDNSEIIQENKHKLPADFEFTIPYKEWVKFPYVSTPTYKRLGGDWTDVFARYLNSVSPFCVLVFKYNRIARSSRAAYFGQFSAKCKHSGCKAVYKMTIAEEPMLEKDVVVRVSRTGEVSIENENKSRFVQGCRRDQAKEHLQHKTPYMYRSELLVDADVEQLDAGNFSKVPSKNVLKQVRAEERQYEKLSDCVIREVYAVKRTLELLEQTSRHVKGYVQYIGFDPFFVINFCAEQIDVLSDACKSGDAFLYFDATGLSMKRPLDNPKGMYMYCLVLRTRRHNEGIRIAEMLTNDHSTPSITNFLMRIRHAVTSTRQYRAPRKIETDFSFAMIHSATRAFNSCDLVAYLKQCWDSISNGTPIPATITVLHICAAHMLKIFQRMVIKCTESKPLRKFWLYVLARMQTSTSMDNATKMLRDLTTICKSSILNVMSMDALDRLKAEVQFVKDGIENEVTNINESQQDTHEGSLRTQSPFHGYFRRVVSEVQVSKEPGKENPYYNPILLEKLLKEYMAFFPLWSGVLLSESDRNIKEGHNRDSNAVVERHFATVKHEILRKERNINPGKACRLLYVSAKGLAKCAAIPSRKRKVKDDIQEEEKWNRSNQQDHIKKKKSKYFSTPSKKDSMTIGDIGHPMSSKKCDKEMFKKSTKDQRHMSPAPHQDHPLPSFDFVDGNAMRWGGFDREHTGITLSNTCTIDNILTAIYIILCSRNDVLQNLTKCTDTSIQVVLEICLNEMVKQKWTEAKVKFVKDLLKKQGTIVNLYGSEFEMAVKYLVRPQRHTTTISCVECVGSRSFQHELIELGIGKKSRNTIHELLYEWEHGSPSRCPLNCGGITRTYQTFDSLPVLLFIAADIASAADRLRTDSLSDPITITSKQYDLYAATFNTNDHFRMLVRSDFSGPWYSYDGLRRFDRFIRVNRLECRSNETVVHLIYLKRLID